MEIKFHKYLLNVMSFKRTTLQAINNGTVVEIVISNKNEKPAHPHALNVNSYLSPTFCDYCGEILVGLVRQGLKCSSCNLNFHKKCAFAAHNNCALDLPFGASSVKK